MTESYFNCCLFKFILSPRLSPNRKAYYREKRQALFIFLQTLFAHEASNCITKMGSDQFHFNVFHFRRYLKQSEQVYQMKK